MAKYFPNIFTLFFVVIFSSCVQKDYSRSGKLNFLNSSSKKSFSFVVSDDFARKNHDSKPDKKNPKMSEVEANLLRKFLIQNNYCINKNSELSFVVLSKQEKIYDVTFSSLIEQNYNAKPVTPVTYFGECS